MRVLVTGGTGFLGRSLVEALRAAGHALRLLVRPTTEVSRLLGDGAEVVRGDALDAAAVRDAARRCEGFVHAAALVRRKAPEPDAFERVNVRGAPAALRAAHDAGVKRILYTSSFFALGPSDAAPGGILDETHPRDRSHWHTPYERSKVEADRAVRSLAAEGLPVLTLYPGVLYGPGPLTEGNLVGRLVADFAKGAVPAVPGRGDRRWCYAFVEDVALGHALALERGEPGARYILGGDNRSVDEFFALLAKNLGRRPPRFHAPYALLSLLAAIEEARAALRRAEPRLTRGEVSTYRHHWAYDDGKARRELGYRSRTLEEGLAATVKALLGAAAGNAN